MEFVNRYPQTLGDINGVVVDEDWIFVVLMVPRLTPRIGEGSVGRTVVSQKMP